MKKLKRIGHGVASLSSRLLNVLWFKGNPDQTTSAAAHLLRLKGDDDRAKWINRLFFWQEDHCAKAWATDVAYAEEVLAANKEFTA